MVAEKQPAGTFAHKIFAQVADTIGDVDADLYLARVIAELFEMSPGLRELVSDLLVAELSEALHRRGAPGREAARMVAIVQRDWSQEV